MKKFLIIFCASLGLIMSACSQKGDIDKAFDMIQDGASSEKVFDTLTPVFESGNIDQLTMEEKCKLVVAFSYPMSEEASSALASMDDDPSDSKIFKFMQDHSQDILNLIQETTESAEGCKIYRSMTGKAQSVVKEMIPGAYE